MVPERGQRGGLATHRNTQGEVSMEPKQRGTRLNTQELGASAGGSVRAQIPALHRDAEGDDSGGQWVYLDSAATTLTPQPVIDALAEFYATETGSAGRGGHRRARRSTERFEAAREKAA